MFLHKHPEYTYETLMAEPEWVIEGKLLLDAQLGRKR